MGEKTAAVLGQFLEPLDLLLRGSTKWLLRVIPKYFVLFFQQAKKEICVVGKNQWSEWQASSKVFLLSLKAPKAAAVQFARMPRFVAMVRDR